MKRRRDEEIAEKSNDAKSELDVAMRREKLRTDELVLKNLVERRKELGEQLDAARLQRQRLRERSVLLQERQLHLKAQRIKYSNLQKELEESLLKSKDRLNRLMSLERNGGGKGFAETILGVSSAEDGDSVIDATSIHAAGGEPKTTQVHQDRVIDASAFRTKVAAVHDIRLLKEFNAGQHHPRSLVRCFPALEKRTLARILLLSMRESNSLDGTQDNCHRRYLIWHTCLDLVLVSKAEALRRTGAAAQQERTGMASIDPNVPLCQYELEGICRDKFCPYQHTRKPNLARERIPLPRLPIRPKTTNRGTVPSMKLGALAKLDGFDGAESESEDDSENLGEISDAEGEDAEQEDFIVLPTRNPHDGTTIDDAISISSESEAEEESQGEQRSLVLETIQNQPNQATVHKLWWGGTLDESASSVDEVLSRLGGLHVQDDGTLESKDFRELKSNESLAALIDWYRITIHSGRFDACIALGKFTKDARRLKDNDRSATMSLLENLGDMAFKSHQGANSFYHTEFNNQVRLFLLSEYVQANSCFPAGFDTTKVPFHSQANDCLRLAERNPEPDHGLGKLDLKQSDLSGVLAGMQDRYYENIPSQYRHAAKFFREMKDALDWVYFKSPQVFNECQWVELLESSVLKPCWAATSVSQSNMRESEDNKRLRALKVTVIMGHVLLSGLERFAEESSNDCLDPSSNAALISVDVMVCRVLKDLWVQFRSVPWFETLLTPLLALNVSTAVFLRKYSTAHERLVGLLGIQKTKGAKEEPRLTRFSELLWSQFLQLRMTLPAPLPDKPSKAKRKKKKAQSRQWSWEVTKEILEDNDMLLDHIFQMGIRPHHICLQGDWQLSHAISQGFKTGARLNKKPPKKLQSAAEQILMRIFLDQQEEAQDPAPQALSCRGIALTHRIDRSRRIAGPLLSTLPRSLLLAGEGLKELDLEKCQLENLPAVFGLYFPNLTDLNLSRNSLKELPESLGSMIRLTTLDASHNELEVFTGKELMASLQVLKLSHNGLRSWNSLQENLGRRCFQLQELDLSHNTLDEDAQIYTRENCIPQWISQLKDLRKLIWEPQRSTKKKAIA